MARAQRNRGGKDHENKRQRRRDTVVTEGNGNTKQSPRICVVKHISRERGGERRPIPRVSNHFLLPLFLYRCDFFFLLSFNKKCTMKTGS